MLENNEKLCWALAEGLDIVVKQTHTNEEWAMYHLLCRSIKTIYGVEFGLVRYVLSGEKLTHAPIIREVKLSEVFDYLNES